VPDADDRIPEATVWAAPREPVTTDELMHEGPSLPVFYLFDWSKATAKKRASPERGTAPGSDRSL
jgi:hypothetical protein